MAATQITTHKNYIGGQWVDSVTGRTYQVHNPARTHEVVGEFQTSGADDAMLAVAAAREGLAVWANAPAPARAATVTARGASASPSSEGCVSIRFGFGFGS